MRTAAVCVYDRFASVARDALEGTGVLTACRNRRLPTTARRSRAPRRRGGRHGRRRRPDEIDLVIDPEARRSGRVGRALRGATCSARGRRPRDGEGNHRRWSTRTRSSRWPGNASVLHGRGRLREDVHGSRVGQRPPLGRTRHRGRARYVCAPARNTVSGSSPPEASEPPSRRWSGFISCVIHSALSGYLPVTFASEPHRSSTTSLRALDRAEPES